MEAGRLRCKVLRIIVKRTDSGKLRVSSNTEDLLPCLLGMYDSIAAARKLRTDDDEIEAKDEGDGDGDGDGDENVEFVDDVIVENEVANRPAADDHVIDNETDSRGPKMAFVVDNSDGNGRQSATASECSSANAPPAAESPWCRFRDVSSTETCPNSSGRSSGGHLRPGSPASLTSMSSRYSVCSHGSSSDDSIDDADNESNRRCIDDGANLADESADSLVLEDSNRAKNAKPSTVQPRTSYTTASQYSEDSGIYSNLVRSESMHERSWCCSDGEDFTYTNRVILEILETELVYVNDLHQIITGYLDEWRNDRNCALSHEQIHDLFNNIEEIYNFNR